MANKALSGMRTGCLTVVYLALAGLAIYGMRLVPTRDFGIDKYMEAVTTAGRFPNGVSLRKEYTGIHTVDFGLGYLVTAFIDGTSGWDPAFQLQQAYFLFSFYAVISIWEVEACRARSGWTLGHFLFLWTIAYQVVGGAIVIPTYYLAYTWATSRPGYFDLPLKVPISVAKSLLPALVIGYLLPTIVLFWPWKDIATVQAVTALWQPAPLVPIVLLLVLPKFMSNEDSAPSAVPPDVKHLKRVYIFVGVVTTCVHLAEIYVFLTSTNSEVSFSRAFIPSYNAARSSPGRVLLFIFQVDFWIIFAASMIWCWQAVWDLRQSGATNLGLGEAAFNIAAASVVLGPGATMCAVWYWRENKLVESSQRIVKKQ